MQDIQSALEPKYHLTFVQVQQVSLPVWLPACERWAEPGRQSLQRRRCCWPGRTWPNRSAVRKRDTGVSQKQLQWLSVRKVMQHFCLIIQSLFVRKRGLTVEFSVCWLMPSGLMTRSIVRFQPCYRHRRHTHTHTFISLKTIPLKIHRQISKQGQRSQRHFVTNHQLAGEDLLGVAVTLSQSAEEPSHALVLLQSGVSLKRLLDEPTQLLGLMGAHVEAESSEPAS